MRLTLTLQRGDALFKFRLLQQVGIPRKDSHVLGKVHAGVLIHRAFINRSRPKRATFQLRYECLLAVKKVELVGIQRPLHGVDYHIHLVVVVELCDLVALAYGTALALLQVAGTPRCVEFMDRDSPFLGIYACPQHGCRAEQHPYGSLVHSLYDGFP